MQISDQYRLDALASASSSSASSAALIVCVGQQCQQFDCEEIINILLGGLGWTYSEG